MLNSDRCRSGFSGIVLFGLQSAVGEMYVVCFVGLIAVKLYRGK